MIYRLYEGTLEGRWVGATQTWVSTDKIAPSLKKAVVAAEDPKFLRHQGFDYEAMMKAYKRNKYRKIKMGGSTISQQTAKNVFLLPSRTYVRKIIEAYFTLLIEFFWGKKRILEVYLNVIELGHGLYGVEAAAKQFWKKSASNINVSEASLLAAILPNPRRWSPIRPTSFVLRRKYFIERNISLLGRYYFAPLLESHRPPAKPESGAKKSRPLKGEV